MTIRVGLIGCGGSCTRMWRVGRRYRMPEIVALADVSPEALAQRKAQVGREVKAYTDYLDLLADPNVTRWTLPCRITCTGGDRDAASGQAPDDGEAALPHAGRGGGHRGGGEEGGAL